MKKKLIRPTEMTEDELLISDLTFTVESLIEKIDPNRWPLINTPYVERIIRRGNKRLGRVSYREKMIRLNRKEEKAKK